MNYFKSSKQIARELSQQKIAPEIVAKFRPPFFETATIAFLIAIQGVAWLAVGAIFLAFWLPLWNSLAWLLPVCGGLFWLGVMRGVWLGQAQRGDGFFLITAETFIVLLIFRFSLLFFRPEVIGFSDGIAALDGLFLAIAWSQGRSLGFNVYRLYLQPYEILTEEGGGATNDTQIFVEHFLNYRVIQQRWMWCGLFVLTLIIAAVLMWEQRNQTGKAQDYFNSMLLGAVVYIGSGLLILSIVRLRYLRTGWRLNRLKEPPTIGNRWIVYVFGLVLFVGLLTAILPRSYDTNWVNSVFTGQRDEQAAQRFQEAMRRLFPCATPDDPRCRNREVTPSQNSELFRLPEEISIILLSMLAAGFLFGVAFLLVKSGIPLPSIGKFSIKNSWRDLIVWLKSLFARRIKADRLENARKKNGLKDFFGRFQRERIPPDLRGQVRYHYKHTLERATRAGYPRTSGTTPAEYNYYLAPKLNEAEAELKTDMEKLTGLYHEARFSPHPLEPEQVNTAAEQTKRLTTFFRQMRRKPKEE
jgi:Domain of unknown function (DUF4129)